MPRLKSRAASSTHKKVVVLLLDQTLVMGYLNAAGLGRAETIDLLTPDGEHRSIELNQVKSIHFVREFVDTFSPERKIFLSRPKLDGLWVRLRFRDEDVMEGIVANDLLDLLDMGVQLTPPDLHGNTLRLFIPRSALAEVKVLGVVGVARRGAPVTRPEAAISQSKLFSE
ncbi:MAG TPA: hypothetical protein VN881_05560 [Candidatus Acidoferrales bacterium]|jgi:hypothetical protein|nr:hypothetical protein [Candidatus Acidoferrales bacterium]